MRRRKIVWIVGFVVLVLVLGLSWFALAADRVKEEFVEKREALVAELSAMENAAAPGPGMQSYLAFYELDFAAEMSCERSFEMMDLAGHSVFVHIMKPSGPRGVVVLVHGYLSHSAQYRHLAKRLLANGFAVAMFDWPGHGLSPGDRADIDDFSTYRSILNEFTATIEQRFGLPMSLIGFSMGGGVVLDYVLSQHEMPLEKVIAIAPLVRCAHWHPSKIANAVVGVFTQRIPRVQQKISHDKAFLRFNKEMDYLLGRSVPINWTRAMYRWESSLQNHKTNSREILVVQGTSDTIVAWKHNMEFIQDKLPNARIAYIKGGYHELFNESEDLRKQTIDVCLEYLQEENAVAR